MKHMHGYLLAGLLFIGNPQRTVRAHEGEQHGEPAPTAGRFGGPVRLSAEARRNLQLEVVDVEMRAIETTVQAYGQVEVDPDRLRITAVRAPGRVMRVVVRPGDKVSAGQMLAQIESRQVGDPPPVITLKSEIDGYVAERQAFPGQPVEPENTLFRIIDISEILVRAHVYERDIASVATGQSVRVKLEAFPDRVFEGRVDRVGSELELDPSVLPVWVRVRNVGDLLRPNMRATVRMVTGRSDDAIAVPLEAVLGDSGTYFVYLDNGDYFEKINVVLGQRDDQFVEIIEGVFPGDRVVTRGNYQLQFTVSPPAETKTPGADKDGNKSGEE